MSNVGSSTAARCAYDVGLKGRYYRCMSSVGSSTAPRCAYDLGIRGRYQTWVAARLLGVPMTWVQSGSGCACFDVQKIMGSFEEVHTDQQGSTESGEMH